MLGKKAFIVFAVTVLSYHVVFSQDISINGKVNSASDVENIHVINKTRQQYTVTNILGLFKIEAHKGDTIQFSSIQHKPLEVVVSNLVFNTKK